MNKTAYFEYHCEAAAFADECERNGVIADVYFDYQAQQWAVCYWN